MNLYIYIYIYVGISESLIIVSRCISYQRLVFSRLFSYLKTLLLDKNDGNPFIGGSEYKEG